MNAETQVQVYQTQAPALSDESRATLDRLLVVRDTLAPDLTPGELQLFAMVAVRSGLDPFARQIYAVKRSGRMTIQTGIDGYRSIAARTGEYDGQDEPTYGPDCKCGRSPVHPESSTVKVYRKGMSRGVAATAFWHEYVPDPGPSGKGDQMWRKMPHVMIAKVAEALALRKAFPWDPSRGTGIGSDVYTTEEMAQADSPAVEVSSVQERVAARAASAARPGISLRDFAQEVVGMEPETVRAVRNEMFPDGRSVSDLGDDERAALLDRLLHGPAEEETEDETEEGEDGTPLDQQAVATDLGETEVVVEVDGDPEPVRYFAQEGSTTPPGCPVVSPIDGAVCDRDKGHRGRHRSQDMSQSW